jgi:hypothetical protein
VTCAITLRYEYRPVRCAVSTHPRADPRMKLRSVICVSSAPSDDALRDEGCGLPLAGNFDVTRPIIARPVGRASPGEALLPTPVGRGPLRHPSHPSSVGWRAVQSELGDDNS